MQCNRGVPVASPPRRRGQAPLTPSLAIHCTDTMRAPPPAVSSLDDTFRGALIGRLLHGLHKRICFCLGPRVGLASGLWCYVRVKLLLSCVWLVRFPLDFGDVCRDTYAYIQYPGYRCSAVYYCVYVVSGPAQRCSLRQHRYQHCHGQLKQSRHPKYPSPHTPKSHHHRVQMPQESHIRTAK